MGQFIIFHCSLFLWTPGGNSFHGTGVTQSKFAFHFSNGAVTPRPERSPLRSEEQRTLDLAEGVCTSFPETISFP